MFFVVDLVDRVATKGDVNAIESGAAMSRKAATPAGTGSRTIAGRWTGGGRGEEGGLVAAAQQMDIGRGQHVVFCFLEKLTSLPLALRGTRQRLS